MNLMTCDRVGNDRDVVSTDVEWRINFVGNFGGCFFFACRTYYALSSVHSSSNYYFLSDHMARKYYPPTRIIQKFKFFLTLDPRPWKSAEPKKSGFWKMSVLTYSLYTPTDWVVFLAITCDSWSNIYNVLHIVWWPWVTTAARDSGRKWSCTPPCAHRTPLTGRGWRTIEGTQGPNLWEPRPIVFPISQTFAPHSFANDLCIELGGTWQARMTYFNFPSLQNAGILFRCLSFLSSAASDHWGR